MVVDARVLAVSVGVVVAVLVVMLVAAVVVVVLSDMISLRYSLK